MPTREKVREHRPETMATDDERGIEVELLASTREMGVACFPLPDLEDVDTD